MAAVGEGRARLPAPIRKGRPLGSAFFILESAPGRGGLKTVFVFSIRGDPITAWLGARRVPGFVWMMPRRASADTIGHLAVLPCCTLKRLAYHQLNDDQLLHSCWRHHEWQLTPVSIRLHEFVANEGIPPISSTANACVNSPASFSPGLSTGAFAFAINRRGGCWGGTR